MATSVPAPAAAVGYDTLTYGQQTGLNSPANPSGDLYPFNFFGVDPSADGVTQNPDGSITIAGGGGDNYGGQLSSASYDPSAPAPYMNGEAFGGGAYFEATMSFAGAPSNVGPSFWANDIESMGGGSKGDTSLRQWPGQPQGYGNWVEPDFAEFDTGNATQYGIGIHNWYGSGSDVNTGSVSGSPITVPPGTDFSQPHKYGFLWVPATATTQGTAEWFFDGQQVGNAVHWDQYSPLNAPPPAQGSSAFSVMDARHLAPVLGSGSPSNPTTVYSVGVWQADASHDLINGVAPSPSPASAAASASPIAAPAPPADIAPTPASAPPPAPPSSPPSASSTDTASPPTDTTSPPPPPAPTLPPAWQAVFAEIMNDLTANLGVPAASGSSPQPSAGGGSVAAPLQSNCAALLAHALS